MEKSRQYSAHAFPYIKVKGERFVFILTFVFQRRVSHMGFEHKGEVNGDRIFISMSHCLPKKTKKKGRNIPYAKYSFHAGALNLHRGKTIVLTRTQLPNNWPEPMIY